MSDLEVLSWHAMHEKYKQIEADAYGYALEQHLRDCTPADLDRIQRACERRREADEAKAEQQREEAIAAGVVLSGLEIWDEPHTRPTPNDLCEWLRQTRPDVIYARHGIRLWYVPTSQYLCSMTAVDRLVQRQKEQQRRRDEMPTVPAVLWHRFLLREGSTTVIVDRRADPDYPYTSIDGDTYCESGVWQTGHVTGMDLIADLGPAEGGA